VLAVVGFAWTLAIAGQWTSARALLAEQGPAIALPALILAVGLIVFILGLVVYVFAPARSPESAAEGYSRLPTVLAMLAVAAIPANLLSLGFILVSGRAGDGGAVSPAVLIASIVPLELALLGVLYFRIVRPGVLGWRELGFSAAQLGTRVAQGFGFWFALILVVGAINAVLQSLGVQQTQIQTYQGVRAATTVELLGLIVAGGVLAPIAEEAFFRGYVFTAYRKTRGRVIAYLLSAGLFAIVHFNLPAVPAIFVIGLGFAFLYDRTRSLIPGIIAHGMNNSLAFIALAVVGSRG
jgi:membrane protease YdiL (CAAX protease family)